MKELEREDKKTLQKEKLVPIVAVLLLASMIVAVAPAQAYTPKTKTFTVSPSGGDDTANIQAAFDSAVAAGPGSTVKLTAGHFYCSNIFVENFRGTFKGAGRDLTVIDTLRGLDPSLPGLIVGEDGYVFFFGFKGGDIRITDMTFDITAYNPAETWVWPWTIFAVGPWTVTDVIRILGNANSQIERVRFVGHEGTLEEGGVRYNVESTIAVIGETGYSPETGVTGEPISGRHTVSECSFEHVDGSVRISYLENGKITITHTNFVETTAAAFLYDLVNSIVEVSYNQIDVNTFAGVFCWQGLVAVFIGLDSYPGPLPANTLILIHHNTIRATVLGEAIVLYDFMPAFTGVKSLNAIVSDNDISLDTIGGGIFGYGVQDVKAINNRITGSGLAGIYLGGFGGYPCTGCLVIGNTFKGFTPDTADIWLWSDTNHCLVVATKGTTVLDEGVHNIIVGAGK